MSLRSWGKPTEINGPRGMWSLNAARRKGAPQRATSCQNARFSPGIAKTRPGTSALYASMGKVTGPLFNWFSPSEVNWVLYQDGTTVTAYNQATSTATPLLAGVSSRASSFADVDVWSFFCGYSTAGAGTQQVRIWDGVNVDKAFGSAPVLTSCTAVDGGAGQCTSGKHNIGFVYQNRDGFQTVPSTKVSGTQVSVTLNAGMRKVNIAVTLPALLDGGTNPTGASATLFLIATPAGDLNDWYFIPTAISPSASVIQQPVPYNTIATLNFVLDLGDGDIYASADPANTQFLWMTQDGSGVGPITPSFVVAYGTRMCYGCGSTLYVSQQNNPQQITADQHAIVMPNQRVIQAAFPLPGGTDLFLSGDRWTARITDNSDVPATWSEPVGISKALGVALPNLICQQSSGGHVFIVTERGVEFFDGQFAQKPLTYLCSDVWASVNWAANYAIQIVDDPMEFKLYVGVPTGVSTEPNALWVIDYQNGLTFDSCDISIDVFPASFSALGVIKEIASGENNLWIGPSAAGNMVHFDSSTTEDSRVAINSWWQSGLARGAELPSKMIRVGAADLWIEGAGTLRTTWAALDGGGVALSWETLTDSQWTSLTDAQWVTLNDGVSAVKPLLLSAQGVPSALGVSPGIEYMQSFDLAHIENFTVQVGTNAVGAWWELSKVAVYVKADLYNR